MPATMTMQDIYKKDIERLPGPMGKDAEREASKADLITCNIQFAMQTAYRFANRNRLPVDDCVQEANMGLCEAAQRWKKERGYKFITYAVWWVMNSLKRYRDDYKEIVRIPYNQINDGAYHIYISLDKETTDDEGSFTPSLHNRFPDRKPSPLQQAIESDRVKKLGDVMALLPERDQDMLLLYYGFAGGEPLTLQEIAHVYGLSRERVRQIVSKAKGQMEKRCRKLA